MVNRIIFNAREYELNKPPPGPGEVPPGNIYKYRIMTGKITQLTQGLGDDVFRDWISDKVLSVSPQDKKKVTWGTLKKSGRTHSPLIRGVRGVK